MEYVVNRRMMQIARNKVRKSVGTKAPEHKDQILMIKQWN